MRLGLALLVLAVATSGCSKCGRDHPYVPYSIGEGGAAATPSASDSAGAASPPDAGEFIAFEAVTAPPNVSEWALEGLTLAAPPGRIFDAAFVHDVDGDGLADAVAVVRTPTALDRGAVVLYKGAAGKAGAPVNLVELPTLATDPACLATPSPAPPHTRLALVGGRAAFVEVTPSCPARGTKDASRWLAVLSLRGEARPPRLQLFITDPEGAPALTFEADASDRDGDGVDDVTLRATLEGGGAPFEPGPKVSATLRWFDRPAGLSRDPDEPDASLRARSGALLARAARSKEAALVPLEARQLAWLFGALCAEGGAPRIARGEGGTSRIPCGASRGLEEVGLAEARAFATLGDPVRAVAAFERAQKPPATKTAARTAEGQAWILQATPVTSSATLRAVSAVPQIDRGKAPAWGALAFEPSGKLLVRTLAGVVRVDPALGDESAAEDVPTWKTQVVSPDGKLRFIEAYGACDGLALRATFAPTADGDPKDVVLPVAPPLGGRCTTAKGEAARVLPLAWGAAGLEAIVAGSPLLFPPDLARASDLLAPLDQPGPLGSPRSPNGHVVVVPTSLGIVVRAAKGRLFRAKELDGGYSELRDCTVADDGTHVACVRGGRAFVGAWDEAK